MARPVVHDTTDRCYALLGPHITSPDADNGWAYLDLIDVLAAPFAPVDDIVRDRPGVPGWSVLLDVDAAPASALPWLAQFAGVVIPPGTSDVDARALIRRRPAGDRGKPSAIVAAVAATLTGSQRVTLYERDGDAYALRVHTYTGETPDSAATLAALTAAKPAGIVATLTSTAGQTWADVTATYATWSAVTAAYATWSDLVNDTP